MQRIGSASGARGSRISIPVSLKNGTGMVVSTELDIIYPSDILADPECVKAARLPNHSLLTSLSAPPALAAGEDRLRALLIDLDSPSLMTDGRLFTCTFTISPSAQPGTYELVGENGTVSDEIGNEVNSNISNGSVTVY